MDILIRPLITVLSFLNTAISFFSKEAFLVIKNNFQDSNPLQEKVVFSTSLINIGATIAIGLTFFLLIVFLALKLITKHYKPIIKFNYAIWVKYIFLLSIVIASVIYIFKTFDTYKFWSVWFVLLMVILFTIHTYILIPKLIYRKRLVLYGAILLPLLVTYTFTQTRIISAKIKLSPFFYGDNQGNIDGDVLAFLVGSSIFLVLFSFLFYYINLLVKNRKDVLYLFDSKLVNGEALVNVIVSTLISVPIIMNVGRRFGIFFLSLFVIALAVFYVQTFILFPNYALKKKMSNYLFYNIIVTSIVIIILFLAEGLQSYLNTKHIDLAISASKVFGGQKSVNIALSLTSLWLIIPAGIYAVSRKKIIQEKAIGYHLFRRKEAELNHLKSQINPHFLFNSLNTVYASALKEESNETAKYIGKLSNLMRFLINDMDKDRIPIQTELDYINDFIELQSIRNAEKHNINIQISIYEDFEYKIAPMLLIPFIENAFKHGLHPNKTSELKFEVKAKNQKMEFIIENSMDKNFKAFHKEKGYGIGIKNVRRRLELIYPQKHDLSIIENQERFYVSLKIYL